MILSQTTLAGLQRGRLETKFLSGRYYIPVQVDVEEGRMLFNFGYDKPLIDEIKTTLEGRKWHGFLEGDGRKLWSAPITQRNLFRLEVMQGKYGSKPYTHWDEQPNRQAEVLNFCNGTAFTPYKHQVEMVQLGLNSRWDLLGAEMGVGKTLAAIILAEMCGFYTDPDSFFWVGPRSALTAAKLEFRRWKTSLLPTFTTYEGLKKIVQEWAPGKPAPRIIVFDEFSKLKNITSQRSVAAKHITDAMRKEYGLNCIITGLSGTPSPKDPTNWWTPCEIVCPGFISEGSIFNFKQRLSVMIKEESIPGVGAFNKLKTWRDSVEKCLYCGEKIDHVNHDDSVVARMSNATPDFEIHEFKPGINEVEKLAKRLNGLAGTWLKKDCLDLPEKRYEMVYLEPSQTLLNIARAVVNSTVRGADALMKLRTLSDGFLYEEEPTGKKETCQGCKGSGKVLDYYDESDEYAVVLPEEVKGGFRYTYSECPPDEDPTTYMPVITGKRPVKFKTRPVDCYSCNGVGELDIMHRIVKEVACPKVDLLKQLLARNEEHGRFVVYAGFTGSIERICNESMKQGWNVLKVDGRGWRFTTPKNEIINFSDTQSAEIFQMGQSDFDKVVFVGQPGAAGMGLTLHAARMTFFYSNDFIPENRDQAEDRIHRLGMDENRGGIIVDCVHLPSDEKIITSLRQSRQLQYITMSTLQNLFKGAA